MCAFFWKSLFLNNRIRLSCHPKITQVQHLHKLTKYNPLIVAFCCHRWLLSLMQSHAVALQSISQIVAPSLAVASFASPPGPSGPDAITYPAFI